MKYNIGDKVIDIGVVIEFWNNPYHYKKAFNAISAVEYADENVFSIWDVSGKDAEWPAGADLYLWNLQKDGQSKLHVNKKLYHLEKDIEIILIKINAIFSEGYGQEDIEVNREINRCEDWIKRYQNKIKNLKNGGRSFVVDNFKDFMDDNKENILKQITEAGGRVGTVK